MKNLKNYALILIVAGLLGGCNIGTAPPGMSEQDAKEAIGRMTPEQKIRFINSSPMTPAEKQAEFAKIEAETGVRAADVLAGTQAPVRTGAGN